jgi:putative transcriptional regulator
MATNQSPFLDGKLLIAMPGIGDPRFERSVIFLCAHSADGAMGIVINKVAQNITFPDLLSRLDLLPAENRINLDERLSQMPVQFGGPVETGRGFVLHTTDYYSADTTLPISERVGLTATLDVLRAIAKGEGPRRSLLALGYSGWGPGQLENEIQRNGWLHCEADEELIFNVANEEKYQAALQKIGIDPRMLSTDAGHA